ncbi:hypothetical protein D0860_04891 [Hortaea werneckii]|uniref:Uncharacterized protein n=1 Tax=Hortaea werneckii TaxID=91943 RepID=A0A3M7H3Q3_HORWE|nr:hypothetical protein D0860_04891 [Hortaea werneckii]
MRHGQGWHSEAVSPNGHQIHDPWLTPTGEQQCRERCENFRRHGQPVVKRGKKIVALPIAEEASDAPCDTGSEVDILQADFPDVVDFDNVKYGWWHHDQELAIDPPSLNARAAKLRRFIRDRPEKEVVLVSHGFFNHYLTGDVNDEGEQTTPWWGETELRTFSFVEGDERAMIRETDESMLRRGAKEEVPRLNRPKERGKSISV